MPESPKLYLEEAIEFGRDRGRGSFLGVQPYMVAADYADPDVFQTKLAGYLDQAQARDWLTPQTIVIFPEHIGTWLLAAGEKLALYEEATLAGAMRRLVLAQPFRFLGALLSSRSRAPVQEAVMRMKASMAADHYQRVFARLARRYGVTLLAGSITLPAAAVRDGRLRVGHGPLYNTAALFRPDGALYPQLVRKVFPIRSELPFTAAGRADDLPVFDTPAGQLGVLVCADSWYPAAYAALAGRGCDLVAVPNFLVPGEVWQTPWAGYDPGPPPADVDQTDVGRLREGEAWLKYALPGRLPAAGARRGIHVFLHGQLWDMVGDGHTLMVDGERVVEATRVQGAALVNWWL